MFNDLLEDAFFLTPVEHLSFVASDTKTPLDELSLESGSVEDASWVSVIHSLRMLWMDFSVCVC